MTGVPTPEPLAVIHLEGNFPGSPVDLRYRFAMRDDLIASLVIAA